MVIEVNTRLSTAHFNYRPLLVGFKVKDLISIRQAIQNWIQEKLLSEVKHEKVNRW